MNKYTKKILNDKLRFAVENSSKLPPTLRNDIRGLVRRFRESKPFGSMSYGNHDKLAHKLRNYGNKGKWALEKLKQLNEDLYVNKTPPEEGLGEWISVELECIFLKKRKEVQFVSWLKKEGLRKQITIKEDGSIKPSDNEDSGCNLCAEEGDDHDDCTSTTEEYGKEIVITFKYKDWDFVSKVCNKLVELGCYVNQSCGTHVHFDCRHLSKRQVSTIANRIAKCVPALRTMLPKSRQNNEYCQKVINEYREGSGRDRYAFVNKQAYNKYKTLEIRGHSGTLDAVKIVNWIRLIKFISKTKVKEDINDMLSLFKIVKLPSDLKDYIMERVAKFLKPNKPRADDVSEDSRDALRYTTELSPEEQADFFSLGSTTQMYTLMEPQAGIRIQSIQNDTGTITYSAAITVEGRE